MKSDASLQGSASVLIILIFLSMSIFGVLSMVSAYSDYKLADKNARWVSEYYALDAEAEQILRDTHAALEDCAAQGRYPDGAANALALAGWDCYELEDGTLAAWRDVSYGDEGRKQNLKVEINLFSLRDISQGRYFEITRWQQWQEPFTYEDAGVDIWEGGGF